MLNIVVRKRLAIELDEIAPKIEGQHNGPSWSGDPDKNRNSAASFYLSRSRALVASRQFIPSINKNKGNLERDEVLNCDAVDSFMNSSRRAHETLGLEIRFEPHRDMKRISMKKRLPTRERDIFPQRTPSNSKSAQRG